MGLDIKCYVVDLDSFIKEEFMITNKGELLILNKKGLDIQVDKYEGKYYLLESTGLLDSYGETIYNSDIVETKYIIKGRENSFIGEICKEKGCYIIRNQSNNIYLWYALEYGTIRVIGSKYDSKSKFKELEIVNTNVLESIKERELKLDMAVKEERLNTIKKMIKEGIGKQFIINMYSEEEYKEAVNISSELVKY